LAVVAILGTLVSLSLPAVQSARESSRRSVCSSNLRQMGIALANYETARRTFPAGNEAHTRRNHAWSSFVLPYLEEAATAGRINYSLPWNHEQNLGVADTVISVYLCPSGIEHYPGKQDYGGVLGTAVLLSEDDERPAGWAHGGILYATDQDGPRSPCRAAEVRDGLSRTLLVSEGVDRGFADMETFSRIGNAFWACGTNCFLHNSPVLNTPDVDGFRSNHLGGVHGLYGDGHVSFMADGIDPRILMGICTKAGGEAVSETP
jgi:hypothetical protein